MVFARRIPFLRLSGYKPEQIAVNLIPEDLARKNLAIPLWLEDDKLVVAMAEPTNMRSIREMETQTRRPIIPMAATFPEIRNIQERVYQNVPTRQQTQNIQKILIQLGTLQPKEMGLVEEIMKSRGVSFEKACVFSTLTDENAVAEAIACQSGIPFLRLEGINPKAGLKQLLPWEIVNQYGLLPLVWIGNHLVVATSDPGKIGDPGEISVRLGFWILPVVCPPMVWDRIFRQLYLHGTGVPESIEKRTLQQLLASKVISTVNLRGGKVISRQSNRTIKEVLLQKGLVTNLQWAEASARVIGIPLQNQSAKVSAFQGLPRPAEELIPRQIAYLFSMVPMGFEEERLIIGIKEVNYGLGELAESLSGYKIQLRLLLPEDYSRLEDATYGSRNKIPRLEPEPQIGEILLKLGLVTENQLNEVQKDFPQDFDVGNSLVNLGYLSEVDLLEVVSLQTGIPQAGLAHANFDQDIARRFAESLLIKHQILPLFKNETEIWVGVANPLDGRGMDEWANATGLRVVPILAPVSVIQSAMDRFVGSGLKGIDPKLRSLVEILINRGLILQADASTIEKAVHLDHVPLDQAIIQISGKPQKEISHRIAEALEIALVDLSLKEEWVEAIDPLGKKVQQRVIHDPVNGDTARLISLEVAERYCALPIEQIREQLVVVFADPFFAPAMKELEKSLHRPIRPCLSPRGLLEDAIQRTLGRKNLGTYLLLAGKLTRSELNNALDLAKRTGVRIGRALVNRGFISQASLYQFLAEQSGIPHIDLKDYPFSAEVARRIPADLERSHGMLPLAESPEEIILAVVDPFEKEGIDLVARETTKKIRPVLVTEQDMEMALEAIYKDDYLVESTSALLTRTPDDSAYRILSLGQAIFLTLFLLGSAAWIFLNFTSYIIILNTLSSLFYIGFSAYKFYLVYRALTNDLEVPVSVAEIEALNDRDLPVYTLLIPVYREADVLPELIEGVSKFDYPTTKLDIKIILEEDDLDTIQAFKDLHPPAHFQAIIVPSALPKTKPKACNYGLIHARGEYIVIYDAEDLPEPDQLKKVLVAFSKSKPEVICIQSKLNYYNRNQNLLTAWFTVEYSMWFDLFLPGLDASNAPIPLGGTSNHFKRDALVEGGAWDPYNVTEDADLGIRLYKRGYKTAIVDSTTYEEANSDLYNWIRQRSRWIKGYIITWLVHMRHPVRLYREIGLRAFLGFQFVVGGTFFAALLNPIYWLLTTLWYLTKWGLIQQIFPGIVFFIGAFCLYLGNFAFMYMNVAGAMRRGYYDMVKFALLSPLYWGLMSIAGWKGFIQIITKPHFWEKTIHGLSQDRPTEISKDNEKSSIPSRPV